MSLQPPPVGRQSKVVTHVTRALVLQLWICGTINAFVTNSLEACGGVVLYVIKFHVIVAKVVTKKLDIIIMAPIPTVIIIDQETITFYKIKKEL
jgi:hypothetical protein